MALQIRRGFAGLERHHFQRALERIDEPRVRHAFGRIDPKFLAAVDGSLSHVRQAFLSNAEHQRADGAVDRANNSFAGVGRVSGAGPRPRYFTLPPDKCPTSLLFSLQMNSRSSVPDSR